MKSDSKETIPKFSWWNLAQAFYYLLDDKRSKYFIQTLVLIAALFYDLLPVLIVGWVVDFFTHYTPGDSLSTFYFYIAILSLSWGIVSLIRLTVKKNLSTIQHNVSYFTKVRGFERLLEFSLGWHDKDNTGNKVQRIQTGVETLKQVQILLSQELLVHLTGAAGVLIVFAYLNKYFLIISLVYLFIVVVIQMSFYKRMVEMNNRGNILTEKAGGTYFEGLNNILTIKTLGVKDSFKKGVVSREEIARDFSINKVKLWNDKWKFFQIVNAVFVALVLYAIGQGFLAGVISLGSIYVYYTYFQKLSSSIQSSTGGFEKLVEAKVAIGRMMPIFWEEIYTGFGKQVFPKSWRYINIEGVNFDYKNKTDEIDNPENMTGIKNLSLKIKKNEKIGVVGKSGSGKSTLAKIFLGLYKIDSGKIKIDETNFYDIKHEEITKHITLVLQDSEMFNLSLKENITLMREFDAKLFEKAISVAQLKDLMDKLPDGLETKIGEKGYRLSGGERQRIGLARAIYKDTQILILDEATSSLDSGTETLIQQALEENLDKKTVISIAHRVSTLKLRKGIIKFCRTMKILNFLRFINNKVKKYE
jgi:ABC-type multidrug transport system fused ATPase/permease subunit